MMLKAVSVISYSLSFESVPRMVYLEVMFGQTPPEYEQAIWFSPNQRFHSCTVQILTSYSKIFQGSKKRRSTLYFFVFSQGALGHQCGRCSVSRRVTRHLLPPYSKVRPLWSVRLTGNLRTSSKRWGLFSTRANQTMIAHHDSTAFKGLCFGTGTAGLSQLA
jgi:hypothetical protein